MRRMPCFLLCATLASTSAFALHGDGHEALERVSQAIERASHEAGPRPGESGPRPEDAGLWLERARLRRLHGLVREAHADLDVAARADAALAEVDLERGRLAAGSGELPRAEQALLRFLERRPRSPEGWLELARVRLEQGDVRARAAFESALALEPEGSTRAPELQLGRARAVALAGPTSLGEAVAGLDVAIAQLGAVPALVLEAARFEEQLGRVDAAAARFDDLARRSARRERWLLEQGELLARAGRHTEARAALRDALQALDRLPAARRASRATQALELRVRAGLESTEQGEHRGTSP